MMKAEIKKKWLEALRSGKYKQTQGVLKDEVGFCCLGVLHDVASGTWHTNGGSHRTGSKDRKYSGEEMLDGPFLRGLNSSFACKLSSMNDDGYDFIQIAKIIEDEVETK